jgi:hypothetical protein
MITIWRFFKFYVLNSLGHQRVPREIRGKLEQVFQCRGKLIFTDMFDLPAPILRRGIIVGTPDCVKLVKNGGKRFCLVGERKGRNYKGSVRQHEFNQVLLYMHILESYQPYPVIGRIAYNNQCIDIDFDKLHLKSILKQKRRCLSILNKPPIR